MNDGQVQGVPPEDLLSADVFLKTNDRNFCIIAIRIKTDYCILTWGLVLPTKIP
jgi:hypothetical protein